jgi:hypothetical protein
MSTAATTFVDDSLDLSNGSVTAVADIDVASAPVDHELAVLMEDHASTVTTVDSDSLDAGVTELEPFDTVTAVESPDGFLLALMRRGDGRAAPVPLAISESMQPIVVDRLAPAAMERTFVPPTVDAPFAPAIDYAALAGAPARRRPWRWVAAAGAFGVLLGVIAAVTVADRPVASVPPSSTFVPVHESLDRSTVATARDQAPTVAADPKPPPPRAVVPRAVVPPAVAKSKSRVRASSFERPSPRPTPEPRPLLRPVAPRKCRDLRCL